MFTPLTAKCWLTIAKGGYQRTPQGWCVAVDALTAMVALVMHVLMPVCAAFPWTAPRTGDTAQVEAGGGPALRHQLSVQPGPGAMAVEPIRLAVAVTAQPRGIHTSSIRGSHPVAVLMG